MTDTKFTPGPWKWGKAKLGDWTSYDLSPGILTKDTGDGTPWGDEIDRANAHLIAAAPELYEALEALFNSYKDLADSGDAGFWKIEDQQEGQQALAALDKAR